MASEKPLIARLSMASFASDGTPNPALVRLLGRRVLKGSEQLQTSTLVGPNKYVGLYFTSRGGDHASLLRWKQNFDQSRSEEFNIVFISLDHFQEDFDKCYEDLPGYYALPFPRRDVQKSLVEKFKVHRTPLLIVMDAESGEITTRNGCEWFGLDPEGERFPWKSASLLDIFKQASLTDKAGATYQAAERLKGQKVILYFGAHIYDASAKYTPKLLQTYQALKQSGKNIEVVWISHGAVEEGFKNALSTMPWLALPYSDKFASCALTTEFEVDPQAPKVVVLDENFNIVNKDATKAVKKDPQGKNFPWTSKDDSKCIIS